MYQGTDVRRGVNPKEKSSFLSIIFLLFTLPIFKKSSKHELQENDVYKVIKICESKRIGDALEKEWNKEMKKPKKSLTKTLFRVFGKRYMWFGFLNLIVKVSGIIIKPLATGRLVSYFSPQSKLTEYDAYYYAGVVIACTIVTNIFVHYYHLNISEIGLQMKIALCSLMYRKSLKLTTSSLIEVTNGKIVTMMAKDVQVFESAISFAHDLWVGLIQVGVMTYILHKSISHSAFIGIGFLVILIPIQIWIGVITKNVRLKTAAKTDERLRRIQEILTSIKLIKLYTWEKYYTKLTNELRKYEMKKIRLIFYLKSIILTISSLSQRFSFYLCILSYTYFFEMPLNPETVFVIITCYNSLHFVLGVAIPMSVSQFAEAKTSMKRIKEYLLIEDIKEDTHRPIISEVKIITKDACVDFLNKSILKNINFDASISLVGITGPVGGGKSTFLKTIMKDVHLTNGTVYTLGNISYASQEPWLFPSTIKENILFGLPYEEKRYKQVIKVCGLTRDLLNFPLQDNTIVNDKGLNLSKGQQARINLARAIYKKSDIYLIDDAMTALDASVSKFVFDECFRGFLKGKLCLMVCHNKQFLEKTDRVLLFENGILKFDNTYKVLENMGVDFGTNANIEPEGELDREIVEKIEKIANVDENADENCELLATEDSKQKAALYGEGKASGKVGFDVYKNYLSHAGGWKLIPLLILFCLLGQVSITYFDYFIKKWLKMGEQLSDIRTIYEENRHNTTIQEKYEKVNHMYMKTMNMYTYIILVSTTLTVIRLFMFFGLTARASTRLHDTVFTKITGACMSFFDQHLSGNILNRFSKDIGMIDEFLPYAYFECVRVFFILIGVSGVIMYINPILTIPTLIILVVMLIVRKYYLVTSRSLKRLDGTTRAPVIGYLNTSLEGLTTIRASGNQQILKDQFDHHQDLNSSATYMYITTSRAFGLWLDVLCSLYITAVVLSFIVSYNKKLVAGDVGVAITQAFGLTGILQWGIRQWTEVENTMTSVERVVEYETAEQEKLTGSDPNNWPIKGRIEYQNVNLRYTNSDKLVLSDVNFVIEPKEKIGIIGRTGAGKSSIISILFRLYDVDGSVLIDDIDIKDIELEIVRSKISIIPQDPVLFAGTLRSNLDPYDKHTDLDLWNVLGEVELKYVVENFELGLSSVVNEGGANFSIGQRQLICLARAILRNNKILVLDEATANIDPQTDALVQLTIKRLFSDCTILTIAHRLNTIINSDRIMVVDFGKVVELDTPQSLLGRRTGIFYSMAKQAGLVN